MKYVKLFESWLNEAEGDEITTFNKNAPRDWPVLKTEIPNVYPNGTLDFPIMETILGRADQSKKTFDKNAKIEVSYFGGPIRIGNDGSIDVKGSGVTTDKNSRKEITSVFRSSGVSPRLADQLAKGVVAVGIGDTGKGLGVYANSQNSFLIFIPENLKESGTSTKSGAITNLSAVVVFKGRIYASNIGQVLCFINKGMADDAVSALTEDPTEALATIFAGEGKAKLLAYEKTIGEKIFRASVRDEDATDPNMKARDGVYTIGPDGTEYIGQILFEFDKANLTEEAKAVLSKSGALRTALQDAGKTIEIVGHADGKGDAAYNDKLSVERAKSVEEYLKTLKWWKAVDATVTVKGMGFKQKVAEDNKGTNPIASAFNRRVEFVIDGAKPDYTKIKKALGLK